MQRAAEQVELLGLPVRKIEPGEYRAYLTPRALVDVMSLLSWGGFSARARQTKQSPLLRMQEGRTLAPKVTLTENTADGAAPAFQHEGFIKPRTVSLISGGKLGDALTSPRSAKEYKLAPNGAGSDESHFVISDERVNRPQTLAEGKFNLLFGFASSTPGVFDTWLVTHRAGASRVRPVSVNRSETAKHRVEWEIETAILR